MIYPNASAESWSQQHRILLSDVHCPECGESLSLDRPIAMKGYRGLEASECKACGNDSGIFRVVPVGTREKEIWNSLRPW